MNINIAFNTIIYIMVFLFPGVLFRRIFFSGRFAQNFDSGNPLERILYSLLFSVICIFLYCVFSIQIDSFLDGKVEVFSSFTSDELFVSFEKIYKNELPDILKSKDSLFSLSKVLFSLYLFSGLLGFMANWLVHIFGLEKRIAFFQFSHKWHYLTFSNKKINNQHRIGDIHTTYIDIATDDGSLFTGRLHEVVINKDGNIEAYTLFNANKFCKLKYETDVDKIKEIKENIKKDSSVYTFHSETDTQFVYLKTIKGNLFTISSGRVLNTSLSFVKISGFYKKIETFSNLLITSLLIISLTFSISYAFWDYHIFEFTSYSKRLVFCINLPLSIIGTILFISSFFDKKRSIGLIGLSFFIMILFFIPYLYVFNCVSFGVLVLIISFYFILLGLWRKKFPMEFEDSSVKYENNE